jgi:hypothetical protein
MPYQWLGDPTAPEAPAELVADLHALALDDERARLVGEMLGLADPQAWARFQQTLKDGQSLKDICLAAGWTEARYAAVEASLPELPRCQARAEYGTGRRLAEVRQLADRGLRLWATDVQFYRYHDQEFDTPQELFAAVQADLAPGSSTAYDLRFISQELYPLAQRLGLEGADRLWNDGTVADTRQAVPRLRRFLAQPELSEGDVAELQQILTDIHSLSDDDFGRKYPRQALPRMPAYHYDQGQGGVLVIVYSQPEQLAALRRRLKAHLDEHLGGQPQ